MPNSYDKAFLTVRSKRLTAERSFDIFMAKLRQDKEFAELENARDALHFKIAEKESLGKDLGNLKSEYECLKIRFAQKLQAMHLTEKDLEPKFGCPLCQDTGLVGMQVCKCVKQLAYNALKAGSDALPKDAPESFEDIKYDLYATDSVNGYKKLFHFLALYSNAIPSPKYELLFLHGAVGTGKTFAAAVTANTVMSNGYTVLFINAQQLSSLFLKYHSAPVNDKYGIFAPLADADFLVIDDLGSEPVYNNVTVPYLYQLIGERVGKPTMITSNLTLKDVEVRYGQRIGSRFADASKAFAINITGEDLRLKNER